MGGRNIRVHGIRLSFVTGSPLFPIFPPLINKEMHNRTGKSYVHRFYPFCQRPTLTILMPWPGSFLLMSVRCYGMILRNDQKTESGRPAPSILQTKKDTIPALLESKRFDMLVDMIPTGAFILPNIFPVNPYTAAVVRTDGHQHGCRLIEVQLRISIISRMSGRDRHRIVHGLALHEFPTQGPIQLHLLPNHLNRVGLCLFDTHAYLTIRVHGVEID